jgi:transcriptional regulator with XRE-family HTH domain
MTKQNPMIMKQPELGLKIVELRKAKGLTQEELVERCNINVRTIQRIEAGEVTPRSYTIKSIMAALGYDFSPVPTEEEEQKADDLPVHNRGFLKTAFIVGILYLVFALLEGLMDVLPILNEPDDILALGNWYAGLKIAVIGTYGVFMLGYYKLGVSHNNVLVMVASVLLIMATTITLSADIYAYYTQSIEFLTVQIVKSVILGALYVALGIGLLSYQTHFGSLALVTAALGIISGVAFLSVIFALPGLTVFTVFEILQVILLYKAFAAGKEKRNVARGDIPAFG